MWLDQSERALAPTAMKRVIERVATQFSGYRQHDAHELLTYLLDGVDEDLNRNLSKPYVERKDADGRPDHVVAEEAWSGHKKRHDSVVVDFFHGQFKSTIACPECDRVSVAFDPLTNLQVDLALKQTQQAQERTLKVTVVRTPVADVSPDTDVRTIPRTAPTQYAVKIGKKATILQFKEGLSKLCGMPAQSMFLADIWAGKVYQEFKDTKTMQCVRGSDVLVVYEMHPDKEHILVYQRLDLSSRGKGCLNLKHSTPAMVAYDPVATSLASFERAVWCALCDVMDVDRVVHFLEKQKKTPSKDTKQDGDDEGTDSDDSDDEIPAPTAAAGGNANDKDEAAAGDNANDKDEATAPIQDGWWRPTFTVGFKTFGRNNVAYYCRKPENLSQMMSVLDLRTTTTDRQLQNYCVVDLLPGCYDFCPRIVKHATFVAYEGERKRSVQELTLRQCLAVMSNPEVLDASNEWYCSSCKKHQHATKQLQIYKLPRILVIQLKRFKYRNHIWSDKLSNLVKFPIDALDMRPFLLERRVSREQFEQEVQKKIEQLDISHQDASAQTLREMQTSNLDLSEVLNDRSDDCEACDTEAANHLYDLFAVANHIGSTFGGHYTAYARRVDSADGEWYHFDDSVVSKATPEEVVGRSAYLLFYMRKDVRNNFMIK